MRRDQGARAPEGETNEIENSALKRKADVAFKSAGRATHLLMPAHPLGGLRRRHLRRMLLDLSVHAVHKIESRGATIHEFRSTQLDERFPEPRRIIFQLTDFHHEPISRISVAARIFTR